MRRGKDSLFYLGIFMFIFWLLDTYSKIFILHAPFQTLWFSSIGLAVTSIALLKRSSFLITSMFSALTVIEGIWDVGFLSKLILNRPLPGIDEYMFDPDYPKWKFIISLYHLFLVPAIIFALIKVRKIHKLGWLGATVFTSAVAFATYGLVKNGDNINCVFKIDYCRSFIQPLYQFENPIRIFLGIFFLSLFLFIPLNILLVKIQMFLKKDLYPLNKGAS